MADDSASIPPRVRQLIIDHIDSVMQLEVLLLIASQPQRGWTAKDVAELLRIDPAWVDAQLRAMAAGGLVAQQPDPAADEQRV